MQSIAYTHAPRQNSRNLLASRGHHVSLTRLSVVIFNLALWAAMIGGVALAVS